MKECKNMFLYGGPIGRKWFIINMLLFLFFAFICAVVLALIKYVWGINLYTKYAMISIMFLFMVLMIYLIIVNYAKRLYDITGNKGKSLLYVILLYVGITALGYIPYLRLASKIIGFCILIFMCIKKGNLSSDTTRNISESGE